MRTLFVIVLFIFSQLAHSATSPAKCNKNNNSNSTIDFQFDSPTDNSILVGDSFRMLTWNVNLMSSWWIAQLFLYYINNQDMNDILTRAQLIADRLKEKNYDIIALQEVGDHASKKILDQTLADAGYFSSKILGEDSSHCNDATFLFNSGITLYSKHPFLSLEYHCLSRAAGLQYFMPKGVVYGKINFRGRIIHIFSLHLQSIQADTEAEHLVLKSHQRELKEFLQSKEINYSDHVFLLGDFNVDAENYRGNIESITEFQQMLDILGAEDVAPFSGCNPEISFDPVHNPMAKNKNPSGTLDNILCVNSATCPYHGSKRIFRFEDAETRLKELSDHYPMEAVIFIP